MLARMNWNCSARMWRRRKTIFTSANTAALTFSRCGFVQSTFRFRLTAYTTSHEVAQEFAIERSFAQTRNCVAPKNKHPPWYLTRAGDRATLFLATGGHSPWATPRWFSENRARLFVLCHYTPKIQNFNLMNPAMKRCNAAQRTCERLLF